MTKIKAEIARNKLYTGKTYDLVEIKKDYEYEIIIGRTLYVCYVDRPCGVNGYKTLEEQSLNTGIAFYKKDSEKASPVWFDRFSIID